MTLYLCGALAVVHLRTRYAIGEVLVYKPWHWEGERWQPWDVVVLRNGIFFVDVRDRVTGRTLAVLRWELSRDER